MGTRAQDGSPPGQDRDLVMTERRHLINLSYRLLGSLADAEDAVQETYARWYALPAQQRDAIASPGAWLTTVASRVCLDVLGSARARRERYVGEWIPEPVPDPAELAGRPADPADRVTLDESVSMAFLVVLESMTPAERVAFILHDVFGYPFADVAGIVGRSPAACRQLASSARRRVHAARSAEAPAPGQAGLVRAFMQAWQPTAAVSCRRRCTRSGALRRLPATSPAWQRRWQARSASWSAPSTASPAWWRSWMA
jgi:RNA polymerase sigma factor (sigma-70 family)